MDGNLRLQAFIVDTWWNASVVTQSATVRPVRLGTVPGVPPQPEVEPLPPNTVNAHLVSFETHLDDHKRRHANQRQHIAGHGHAAARTAEQLPQAGTRVLILCGGGGGCQQLISADISKSIARQSCKLRHAGARVLVLFRRAVTELTAMVNGAVAQLNGINHACSSVCACNDGDGLWLSRPHAPLLP